MNDGLNRFKAELITLVPRLRRFAGLLARSAASADDLLQSTLERGLSRRHQWREGSRLDSWLFSIMNSIWKNELRARSIREGHGFIDVEQLRDDAVQPASERNILLDQVFKQVNALPEAQRKAILLVYVEGYSYQEAANILQIPAGTLMSRLARARMALAHSLNQDESQEIRIEGASR